MSSQDKSDISVKDEDKYGNKNEIRQRFRCISLYETDQSKAILLPEILKECKSGVYDFFTNSGELTNTQLFETFYDALVNNITNLDSKATGWEWKKQSEYIVHENQVMRLVSQTNTSMFHEKVLSYYQRLRAALYEENKFDNVVGFNACQATCWDLFTDRTEQSPIIVDEKHGEYLAWNDAYLWTDDEWEQKKENEEKYEYIIAWKGSGWFGHQIGCYYQNKESKQILDYFPEVLSELLLSKAEILAQYHQGLSDYYLNQKRGNQLLHLKPWQSYITCLCEFLPPYRYTEDGDDMWLPVHTAGGSGEPILWRGILDSHIHMLMRQLLMDGWLCLWPDEKCENLYLHPSSLAMLYWAARHARKPYTATPEEFIKNYCWNEKWFGGRIEGST